MKSKKLLSVLLAAGMTVSMLAGCGAKNEPAASSVAPSSQAPAESQQPEAVVELDMEAPTLKALVDAGKLPAVESRIPNADNVFVEKTDAAGNALAIGTYSEVLNWKGVDGSWGIARPALESIIRYNTDGTYYPNVIKSYDTNADYTVWTFHLREGMKWSDGEPFTADDVTFWYYMCHINNFDTKASWTALKDDSTGEFAKVEKVDDYTVTFTFDTTKLPGNFIENGDFKWCWAPAHFFADLIPDSYYVENPYYPATGLSDEDVLKNAIAKGIDQSTVKDLGKQAAYYSWNIAGIPTINSYMLSTVPGNSSRDDALCIIQRNPYFWKVDAQGRQLPYIDEVHFNKTSEDGQDQLMFRDGTIDVVEVPMSDIASILSDMGAAATLKEFASTNWGGVQLTFNQTCTDENYQKLFANIDFRQALSIAVDRTQVSELLSDGFLEPGQAAPEEGNFGYDAAWSTKWTEYDVAKAKTLLEGCGLKMGADGFYDFADGSDLVLTVYTYTDTASEQTYTVLEQYFNAVGIKCASKDMDVAAFDQEIDNNTWYAVLNPHMAIGGVSLRSRVAPFVPVTQGAEWYGDYGTYYMTNGEAGVKPEGDMAKLVELYEKWNAAADPAERDKITLDIYKVHQDNMWTVGYLKAASTYSIVNSKLQNWPELLIWDDLYQYVNLVHFETLFMAE